MGLASSLLSMLVVFPAMFPINALTDPQDWRREATKLPFYCTNDGHHIQQTVLTNDFLVIVFLGT